MSFLENNFTCILLKLIWDNIEDKCSENSEFGIPDCKPDLKLANRTAVKNY